MTRLLLTAQGVYYLLTGLWPLVSMATFEAVTGPKTDDWLVRMVGVLAAVIGVTLLVASRRRDVVREIIVLAVAAAAGFAAIDVIYVLQRTIPPIYLGDAVVEVMLATALLVTRSRASR